MHDAWTRRESIDPVVRPRLLTIPISHYGERARWALDRAGVRYDETHHLQGFSWVPARWHGGGVTLPVLLTADGVIADSRAIVRWADRRAASSLLPTSLRAEIEPLEDRLAGAFGVAARLETYGVMLPELRTFSRWNEGAAPRWQAALLRALSGPATGVLRTRLGVTEPHLVEARACVDRTFDEVGERLADGRPFLVGDTFTAADLAFATMSAAVLLPPRYGVPLPDVDALPPVAAARIRALRDHPAGRFAARLYEARPPSTGSRSGR